MEKAPGARQSSDHAIEFKATVMQQCTANPGRWLTRERQNLIDARRARTGSTLSPIKEYHLVQNQDIRTPPEEIQSITSRLLYPMPTRKPTSSMSHDEDFNALDDECPPISSEVLKMKRVQWNGRPFNLANDPNRHLLHKTEALLASILRLNCATYLTSKRRIFLARISSLKNKTKFTKTIQNYDNFLVIAYGNCALSSILPYLYCLMEESRRSTKIDLFWQLDENCEERHTTSHLTELQSLLVKDQDLAESILTMTIHSAIVLQQDTHYFGNRKNSAKICYKPSDISAIFGDYMKQLAERQKSVEVKREGLMIVGAPGGVRDHLRTLVSGECDKIHICETHHPMTD